MTWKPYVVAAGDHLPAIAFRLGADADAIWKDPRNRELSARRDPHMLAPGDVLYVPEPRMRTAPLRVGDTNRFTAEIPHISVRVRLVDEKAQPRKHQPVEVRGVGHVPPHWTDGDGVLELGVPVCTRTLSLLLVDEGIEVPLFVGGLDPAEESSGQRMRLSNLGFMPDLAAAEPADGLPAFTAVYGPVEGDPWREVRDAHGC
jgi:hypothetical protein